MEEVGVHQRRTLKWSTHLHEFLNIFYVQNIIALAIHIASDDTSVIEHCARPPASCHSSIDVVVGPGANLGAPSPMDDGCIHESNGSGDPGHYPLCATLEQLNDISLPLLHNTLLHPDDDTRTSGPPSVLYPPLGSRYQAHQAHRRQISVYCTEGGPRWYLIANWKVHRSGSERVPTSMNVSLLRVSTLVCSLESGLW